ncbi:DUF4333 domain-containing protein [Streptomyces tsukubensis]|uniref:DUF4333 domain-containing protein n=1 Tax=Streptomyces tsukubensis TaxID=83656 RepID=A0A1V4A825_9ACTN|nr:DUF4333 domain-containing protein [Streptomyces tsukubensis]OON78831.1 hypothetical protein B1H18_15815 [Streptomyces tsukubensis]
MKRSIIIALGVVAVLAAGVVTWMNMAGDGSVATAGGDGRMVSRADIEERAAEDFSYPDDDPDAVNCPSGLLAKEGTTVRCTAVFGEKHQVMEVYASKVEGDQVSLSFGLLK